MTTTRRLGRATLAAVTVCSLVGTLTACHERKSDYIDTVNTTSTVPSAHSATSPTSSLSTSAPATDAQAIADLSVYLHNTMALGAPMINFGDGGNLKPDVDKVTIEYWNNVAQLRTAMMQHKVQLAAAPAYTSANLYNKGIDARMVAQVVWGMLYVIGPDTAPEGDWQAMKGKKVAVVMPGEMVDLVFSFLLKKNGMNKDTDITYVPVTEPRQAVAMLAKGEVQWAVLPEQLATVALMKNKDKHLKRVLNLQEEYGKATGGPARFPMAGLIMDGKLIDEHPDLPKKIVAELTATTAKVDAGDPAVIDAIAKQYKMKPELVKNIIPRLNVHITTASQARPAYEEFLKNLAEVNPDVYGGKLPDAKFYAD